MLTPFVNIATTYLPAPPSVGTGAGSQVLPTDLFAPSKWGRYE
jgi:hypothetical protein